MNYGYFYTPTDGRDAKLMDTRFLDQEVKTIQMLEEEAMKAELKTDLFLDGLDEEVIGG